MPDMKDAPPNKTGPSAAAPSAADGAEAPGGWSPELRFLKTLVTVLTAVMIFGVITIVVLLVIRLQAPLPPPPSPGQPAPLPATLPSALTLPEGARPTAVTFGAGWIAVVNADREILLYDAANGTLRQRIALER